MYWLTKTTWIMMMLVLLTSSGISLGQVTERQPAKPSNIRKPITSSATNSPTPEYQIKVSNVSIKIEEKTIVVEEMTPEERKMKAMAWPELVPIRSGRTSTYTSFVFNISFDASFKTTRARSRQPKFSMKWVVERENTTRTGNPDHPNHRDVARLFTTEEVEKLLTRHGKGWWLQGGGQEYILYDDTLPTAEISASKIPQHRHLEFNVPAKKGDKVLFMEICSSISGYYPSGTSLWQGGEKACLRVTSKVERDTSPKSSASATRGGVATATPQGTTTTARITVISPAELTGEVIENAWQDYPAELAGSVIHHVLPSYNVVAWGKVQFTVTRSGILYLALDYSYEGHNRGDWTRERWSKTDFETNGWTFLASNMVRKNDPNDPVRVRKVCQKMVTAGESYSLRCNKYEPPYPIELTDSSLDAIPPNNITNFFAIPGNGQVILSWINPTDPDFAGVKILRKTDGYPSNTIDGTIVYNSMGTNMTDTGLVNGTSYYYKAFSYTLLTNYASGVMATKGKQ